MKKIYIFLGVLLTSLLFISCTNDFSTTANETTNSSLTATVSSTIPATTYTTQPPVTTTQIDFDMVISDVYQMIYEELYDQVRAEVISNLSEERFELIYAQVIEELTSQIEAGTITISAASVIDMIYNVQLQSANSVVGVISYDDTGQQISYGSGVIYKHVANKYYVVSNNHVVEEGTSFEIQFEDESTSLAILVGVDDLVDVSVLYFLSDDEYTVSDFGDSSQVNKGDIILAVGHPRGYDFYGTMTMGIVSGLDRFFDIDGDNVNDMFVNYIQHDAAINSGNSGGALFDINGDVIGINVIKLAATDIEGMGFAIPSNLVAAICADIEEFGYSLQKPVLGINFREIGGHVSDLISIGAIIPNGVTEGFYIFAIVEGASFDGYVQEDDVIVQIADIVLTSAEDFVYNFSKYKVGDIISISLYRDGVLIFIDNIELKAKVAD